MSWQTILGNRSCECDLPGAELEPFPYLSGYGLVLRVTRLTSIEPRQIFSTLGIRMHQTLDVLTVTRRETASRARLETALDLQGTPLLHFWSEEAWSPLRTQRVFTRQEYPVRNCPLCARFGYHCMLFQLPSIDHCPWHGCSLSAKCTKCRQPTYGRFDAGGYLGRCECGHDSMDDRASVRMWDFPTDTANAWLTSYLTWANTERESRHLVVPMGVPCGEWDAGFAALAQPPRQMMNRRSKIDIEVQVFEDDDAEPPERAFWGWCLLGTGSRPVTYTSLPRTVLKPLTDTTRVTVASLLPQDASDAVSGAAIPGLASDRTDFFLEPYCEGMEGSIWLNLAAVDSRILQICGSLVDVVASHIADISSSESDRSWQAKQSAAIDTISGRTRLGAALEALLIRGYAQGLEAVLRRLLSQPWPANHKWSRPVIEVSGGAGQLRAIRVAWQSSDPPRVRPLPTAPEPQTPPSPRRERRLRRNTKPPRKAR
ncbi:hypothetical protein [Novilysobacter defluvii]|uniref:hypothetical protein n=1 Tax=Novilysobacter defluvii TaxID=391738 RepID=UPI0012B58F9B|nr:hypothetical protein [Lysobacter defluvii]